VQVNGNNTGEVGGLPDLETQETLAFMARRVFTAAVIFALLVAPTSALPWCHLGLGNSGQGCCCAQPKSELPPCCQKKAERKRESEGAGWQGPSCHCRAVPAQPASPAREIRATAITVWDGAIASIAAPAPALTFDRGGLRVVHRGPADSGPPLRVLLCAWRI